MRNVEKHPKWAETRKKVLSGAISYHEAARELDSNKGSVWYAIKKKEVTTRVPAEKIRTCRREGCNEKFITWSWNAVDCQNHRGKSKIKYPVKR